WFFELTECEMKLVKQLREDFETSDNTFGLREELLDCLEFRD
ncbi:20256_t:CDS:1, partial [Racocetra persica]